MARVVWRRRAVRHLHEIHDYLRQHNPAAAADYAEHLYQVCIGLGEFPEKAPRYQGEYRAQVFRNHLIFYRHDRRRDLLTIVGILDGRRDIQSLLRGFFDSER